MNTSGASVAAVDRGDVDAQIGERVHTLMFRARISQTAMGPRMGISQGVLSKKLRGEVAWFARDIATAADVLGVTPNELLGWAPWGSNPQPTVSTYSQVSAPVIALDAWRDSRPSSAERSA